MTIFASRTPRERGLIIAAAALLGLFLVWQFGVRPVMSMKAKAEQSQQTALRNYDIVQRGLPQMSSAPKGDKAPFNRAVIIASARSANVAISRVQPGADEALQVWFEDTQAPNIYRLLADISAKYDVSIERVQMTRRESGRVSAQVTLTPG